MLSPIIKKMLAKRLGHEIRISADCERLSADIDKHVRQHVGVTTLKRMTGFVGGVSNPRLSTLDIIAMYLGSPSYHALLDSINPDRTGKSDPSDPTAIKTKELLKGQTVTAVWHDGQITLRHLGRGKLTVVQSDSRKIIPGDTIETDTIRISYPLYIRSHIRENIILPTPLPLGHLSGILSIKLID